MQERCEVLQYILYGFEVFVRNFVGCVYLDATKLELSKINRVRLLREL